MERSRGLDPRLAVWNLNLELEPGTWLEVTASDVCHVWQVSEQSRGRRQTTGLHPGVGPGGGPGGGPGWGMERSRGWTQGWLSGT